MEQNLKLGGLDDSLTPSTRLLSQKLGTSPAPRLLTPSEIELLIRSKQELAAVAFATTTRASTHKVAAAA